MKSKNLNYIDENEQLSSLSGLFYFFPIRPRCNFAIEEEAIVSCPGTNTQRPANSVFESWTISVPLFACPHRELFQDKLCHKHRLTDRNTKKEDGELQRIGAIKQIPFCHHYAATEVLPVFLLNINQTIRRKALCLSIASHLCQKHQLFYAREHFYSAPLACGVILYGFLGDIRAPPESSSLFIRVTLDCKLI